MAFIRMRKAAATVGLASIVVLAGCSDSSETDPPRTSSGSSTPQATLARIQESGTIRVGYANEAPLAFMDSASGQLSGEAPAVLRHVMSELGIEHVEGVLTEFGSLIPGLQAGRFDAIAAGMYITPERCKQVSFSNPTYSIGSAFIVAEGNPKGLHSFEDVAKAADATLGVVVGAIESEYATQSGVPQDRIVIFPDAASALAGVQAGRVDAYAATALTVNDLLAKGAQGVERAQPFTDPEIDGESVRGYGAFAFRQDDVQLLEAFNNALKNYIGSEEHLAAVKPFGFTENELPGAVTAEALCAS